MARLLIVHHTPSPATAELLAEVQRGASDPEITGVEVTSRAALAATASDLLACDGVLLGTPANIGYMSGALKHFFDSLFLRVGGALADDGSGSSAAAAGGRKPFGLAVHGRYDTTGAVRSVLAITGMPFGAG